MKRNLWLFGMLAVLAGSAGCAALGGNNNHRSDSLYNYLYSARSIEVKTDTIPELSLPLRVGIAFVPGDSLKGGSGYYVSQDSALSEGKKIELMKQISAQFKSYPFVKSIDLIPTAYLTPQGGFENLEQLKSIYGVDVMVLLSYDQVQFTGENALSLSYWTIVGAYVIPGEKNDTATLIDAAVFDVSSHKLLFRAPGTSRVKNSATPINFTEEQRKAGEAGFDDAATNLVANIKVELADFKDRVKNEPADYKITTKPGYTGAASFGETAALLICAMGASYQWTRRHHRRRA